MSQRIRSFPSMSVRTRSRACALTMLLLAGSSLVGSCSDRNAATSPLPPVSVANVALDLTVFSLAVGEERNVQATPRDAAGNVLASRAVQWQSSRPDIVSVRVSANSSAATIVAVAPGTTTITATSEGKSASLTVTVTVTAPVPDDFAIVDAQWTQAAQQPDGSIPVVLNGNGALLNVRLSSTAARRAPGAIVLTLADANGSLVRMDSVKPAAFVGTATADAPTAQFLVPAALLRPGVRWRVERDPRHAVVDDNAANDVFPRASATTMSTVSLPLLRLRFVPITLSAHSNLPGNVNISNVEQYLSTLRRVFPLGQLATSVRELLVSSASFGTPPRGGAEAFWLQVLQDVDLARVTDTSARDAYWIGVIAPPTGFTFTTYGGYSYVPSDPSATGAGTRSSTVVQVGWFSNTGQTADLVPHELAHTLGRRHAPCGGAAATDPAFPDPGGTIGTVGFDVYAWSSGQSITAPPRASSLGDVMGYCFPVWVSPYTYASLLQARLNSVPLASAVASTGAAVSAVTAPVRQRVMVVRAQIINRQISVLPALTLDGMPTDDPEGAYRVELLDARGRVLTSARAHAASVDHSDAQTLLAAMPLPVALAEHVATVRVRGPAGVAMRQRSMTFATSRVADSVPMLRRVAPALLSVPQLAAVGGSVEATCPPGAQAIAVQDHDTGALLASAHTPTVVLSGLSARTIDISCSDGVRSTVARTIATGVGRSPFTP